MSQTDDNLMVIHQTVCELAVVMGILAERMGHSDLRERIDRRLLAAAEIWQLEEDLLKGDAR